MPMIKLRWITVNIVRAFTSCATQSRSLFCNGFLGKRRSILEVYLTALVLFSQGYGTILYMIIWLFLAWRGVEFLISWASSFFIPYLGFFPYRTELDQYMLPKFITRFANFDGVHYLLIAKSGYAQFEQAFFPLYPLLVHAFSFIFRRNYLTAGLVVSNLAFLAGLILFYKYLQELLVGDSRERIHLWIIIFLLTFPTSFFFGAVYTEGLFFLTVIASLYCLKKEYYFPAAFFGFLASLTRLTGLFLIVPFIFSLYSRYKLRACPSESAVWRKRRITRYTVILGPLSGFLAYCAYLWKTTGNPLFFFTSQPAFGAHRSTSIIFLPQVVYRYIRIFITAQWNMQYFVAAVEFGMFCFVCAVLCYELVKQIKQSLLFMTKQNEQSGVSFDRLGLVVFSLLNILLPTLTGTFSSIPRYALFSLSIFLVLGEIKNIKVKAGILFVFAALNALILGLFVQGYFIG